MALAATTIWEVETGGSDTLNGGAFDPGQTAGMFTDGAATVANTSAPVFTSASYNFVAGDVGAWVFIASGTNWTPGWYKIASVAANAATLEGTIGQAVVCPYGTITAATGVLAPSTVVGCATVASPTSATWSIDYSQQSAARFTYTDLASVGAGLTISSAAFPFAKQHVGNSIVITGGTNFTTGRWVIASVAAGVATLVGPANVTTGVGVSGTGGQGGALTSIGQVGAAWVGYNALYQQTGTYTISSATANIATGCITCPTNYRLIEGYSSVRGDLSILGASGTRPTNIASGISTFAFITDTASNSTIRNLIINGASLTSSKAISTNFTQVFNCTFMNCTNGGVSSGAALCAFCSATGCATVAPFNMGRDSHLIHCVAYSNTITGFAMAAQGVHCTGCISYSNSGASSDGFAVTTGMFTAVNCTAYGNGRDGFRAGATNGNVLMNCISESNTGSGFQATGMIECRACATYLNTAGAFTLSGNRFAVTNPITGTASFFTAAGSDFSLNTTAGGGALLRAAGFPGVFPAGGTAYLDVGAVQHADPTVVRFPAMLTGGMV